MDPRRTNASQLSLAAVARGSALFRHACLLTIAVAVAIPGTQAGEPRPEKAYVSNYYWSVSVIETANNTVLETVSLEVDNKPTGLAITPDGTRAYVAISTIGEVWVIDTLTDTVIDTVAVGGSPGYVAITPDGSHVYVTNGVSDTVSVDVGLVAVGVVGTVVEEILDPVEIFIIGKQRADDLDQQRFARDEQGAGGRNLGDRHEAEVPGHLVAREPLADRRIAAVPQTDRIPLAVRAVRGPGGELRGQVDAPAVRVGHADRYVQRHGAGVVAPLARVDLGDRHELAAEAEGDRRKDDLLQRCPIGGRNAGGEADVLRRKAEGHANPGVLLFADKSIAYQRLFNVLDRIRNAGLHRISLQAEVER